MAEMGTNQPPESRKDLYRFIRHLVTGAVILGAILGLIHFGSTLGKSSLDEIVAMYEQRESALREKLESERERSAALQDELARSDKKRGHAESTSKETQKTISELRTSLERAKAERHEALAKLGETRPFLFFKMEPKKNATKLRVVARNTGRSAARIVYLVGQVWFDGLEGPLGWSWERYLIPPEDSLAVYVFSIEPWQVARAKQGDIDLRYVTCVIYESALEDNKGRWMADLWFTYNHEVNKPNYLFSKKNDRQIDSDIEECDLDSLMPAGWIDEGG